jgi:hypothetical protein
MTVQDFITIWQAQPFRAFRMYTTRGEFDVKYPMGAALTPDLRVAVVVDDTHARTFALDEIKRCEAFGQPMSLVEVMGAIPAETLVRHVQLISTAQASSEPDTVKPSYSFDPGTISLLGAHAADGVHLVHTIVQTREGVQMLSTVGTRWNLHGVEQFENGTSLYLHHLDHPTVEQRIILWPPDKGTFESFGEALSASALEEELRQRDAKLAARPEKPVEPPPEYFRKIAVEWKLAERDGWAEAFGEDAAAMDPARYEFVLVPHVAEGGREVRNPCLTDIMKEEIVFNLVETDWDAAGVRDDRTWHVSLRHASGKGKETTLHIDGDRRGATIDQDSTLLPLGWIERHLRNFALYQSWNPMHNALLGGPVKPKQPDVSVPLLNGFLLELWAGEPRFSTPFLQPHIIDAEGRTVLDLRATTWSATVRADEKHPVVTLVFLSGEQGVRGAISRYPLEFDLISHRVTCPNLEGSTSIGMVQAMVRRVRGVQWMLEEIPKWFEKGRNVR